MVLGGGIWATVEVMLAGANQTLNEQGDGVLRQEIKGEGQGNSDVIQIELTPARHLVAIVGTK